MANILNIYDKDTGTYVSIPAIKGADGQDGYTPVKGVDYFDGADGKDGTNGTDGIDGKSAYEVALDNGFVGTEAEWLESLKSTAVATEVEDIYQVALENGGCIKGYEYKDPDKLLYNAISEGVVIPTDSPVYSSGVSIYNALVTAEQNSMYKGKVFDPATNPSYDRFIQACGHQWIILASTAEDLTTIGNGGHDYLLVYDIAHKCLRLILYPYFEVDPKTGKTKYMIYTFGSVATIYDEDVQRLESFYLPAERWYLTTGMFTLLKYDGDNDRINESFDIPQERIDKMYQTVDGDYYDANYDPNNPGGQLPGQPYEFVITPNETPSITTYYYDESGTQQGEAFIVMHAPKYSQAQKNMLNQFSLDTSKDLVYYTKEEWAVLIETTPPHFHKCNDIIDFRDHTHKQEDIIDFEHTHVVEDITNFPDLSVYISRPLQESHYLNGENGEVYDKVPTVGYVQSMVDEYHELFVDGLLSPIDHEHEEYLTQVPASYPTKTEMQRAINDAISGIETGTTDLSNYYTKAEVNSLIDTKLGVIENGSY